MSVAGACPLCNRVFPWTEVPAGATAVTCPNCDVPVEIERAPPPMPPPMIVPLVATFPKPALPPTGMAVVRAGDAPPPPVVAAEGPFRTAGHAFVERRVGGTLTIEFPARRGRGPVNAGAVVWSGMWGLLGVVGAFALPTVLLVGATPTVLSLALRRRRHRITIDPRLIRAGGERVPRESITHIFCAGVYNGAWTNVLWHVRVRAGHRDYLLVATDSLDDANALAALLASELGLPTWVPNPSPRPGR